MIRIYYTEREGVITYYHNLADARKELIEAGFDLAQDLRLSDQFPARYVKTDHHNILQVVEQVAYIKWINVL